MRVISTAILTAVGLSLTACGATTANRSVHSERQPVVTRSHYVLDVNLSGGTVPTSEQRRLAGWFEALDLGYGDRVAIDDPSYTAGASARGAVETMVAQYGLLINDVAPVTEGYVPNGAIRVVVSRSTAEVPGCPDWGNRSHTDFQARTSENYGCGTNSTMAAMIADPEDLVRGQSVSDADQTRASKAIRAYRDKKVGGPIMNAPWKPGEAATNGRDPFAAYVCDEDTLDILRPVAEEMGWPIDKCHKGGLRNAVQSLSVAASPNILLVDLSESGDPLSDINSLAEVCEPGTVVIAMGQVNDVRLYRDLIVSGLQDYLLKPFSPEQLRDVLGQAQVALNAPKAEDANSEKPHVSTAIIGTRGGVGASTIATSLAWLMSNEKERLTALLDLDVHFGTGALALDLEPGRGLTDAIDNPSRIDGLFIERAMIKANEKLSLLSAEAPINSPMMTDGTAFFQLQEEFRAAFECTIIDLPRDMLINYPHLLGDVNATVIVTELTLASARDAIRLLSWLKSHAAQSKVIVVANKVSSGNLEISRQDFESSIERKIDIMIPSDPKTAAQSAKLGQAFVEAGKSSKATSKIIDLSTHILGAVAAEGDEEEAAGKSSLMGKLSAMLPSKKKAEKKPAEE